VIQLIQIDTHSRADHLLLRPNKKAMLVNNTALNLV